MCAQRQVIFSLMSPRVYLWTAWDYNKLLWSDRLYMAPVWWDRGLEIADIPGARLPSKISLGCSSIRTLFARKLWRKIIKMVMQKIRGSDLAAILLYVLGGGVRLFQKPMGLLTRDTLLIVYGRSYICDIYLQFLCNYSNSTFLANTKLLSSRINILFIYIYY